MILRTRPAFAAFDDVDRMFNQLAQSFRSTSPRLPVVDAAAQDGTLTLTVDLPGTPEDAIHVDVAGRTLTIGVESDALRWSRSIQLGRALDPEQVSAHYLHGRLTVTVAPAPEAQKRSIPVATTAPAIEAHTSEAAGTADTATSETEGEHGAESA
jgi:HSP20 family molecular chaperone IbpA